MSTRTRENCACCVKPVLLKQCNTQFTTVLEYYESFTLQSLGKGRVHNVNYYSTSRLTNTRVKTTGDTETHAVIAVLLSLTVLFCPDVHASVCLQWSDWMKLKMKGMTGITYIIMSAGCFAESIRLLIVRLLVWCVCVQLGSGAARHPERPRVVPPHSRGLGERSLVCCRSHGV